MWRAYVLLVVLSLTSEVPAQEACPWLTQGTAAALMGGDVNARVHVANGEGTCDFTRGAAGDHPDYPDHPGGAAGSSLHMSIAVSHVPSRECVTGEHLTGIGQDAVLCRVDAKGAYREIIRGRVRATYLVLTLTDREASASDEASLRRALEQAAEEVSGNLF